MLRAASGQPPKRPAPGQGGAPPTPARPPADATAAAEIARLTAEAKALLSQSNGGDARSRVALGGVLQKVHERLDHGQWLLWLEATVPFTPRSAQNYIELSAWASATPAVFERVATLGASKVYLISKLPPSQIEQLLAKAEHVVPGTNRRTTLALMKYAEFMKLTLQTGRPAAPTDPMAEILADARASVNRTLKAMKLLIANKQAMDHEAVEDMHDDLVVALQKLSAAFKLD